ncbi:hypothetical protein CLV63_13346 [Murinocardiopsis flavida]|uniref:HAF family extracellular repeat protein n=1 Tax=Murinocardiopsis flavida TaxID=645275 RepID=A0A2P8CPP5_9ACTN|nr:hypothetical protein [Murinocardiopsis flavida]PSK86929.1 hypothetical protein CLV63_13346 [Murinocardiopsis flavida]
MDGQWHRPPQDWRPPAAKPRSGCRLATLPGPAEYSRDPDKGGEVTGMSASGEYVVGNAGRDDVLWHDGRYRSLASIPGLNHPEDVNSAGVVVGTELGTGDDRPWMYDDGELTYLRVPELGRHELVAVSAINDDGHILGAVAFDDGIEQKDLEPLVWHVDSPGEYATPDVESGPHWKATESTRWPVFDRDADETGGTVLDQARAADGGGRVYGIKGDMPAMADGEEVTELPAIAPRPSDASLQVGLATEVSRDGEVVAGTSTDSGGTAFPVTWTCRPPSR